MMLDDGNYSDGDGDKADVDDGNYDYDDNNSDVVYTLFIMIHILGEVLKPTESDPNKVVKGTMAQFVCDFMLKYDSNYDTTYLIISMTGLFAAGEAACASVHGTLAQIVCVNVLKYDS